MVKEMVDALKRNFDKSFNSITLTCFRCLTSVRMVEVGTDDVLAGIEDEVLGT